jgi:hypothetical protein
VVSEGTGVANEGVTGDVVVTSLEAAAASVGVVGPPLAPGGEGGRPQAATNVTTARSPARQTWSRTALRDFMSCPKTLTNECRRI